jgi:hypothetical protein
MQILDLLAGALRLAPEKKIFFSTPLGNTMSWAKPTVSSAPKVNQQCVPHKS